jgi:hypothetical protein
MNNVLRIIQFWILEEIKKNGFVGREGEAGVPTPGFSTEGKR